MYIKSLRVTGYTVLGSTGHVGAEGGYVQFCLLVQGESAFMHQMAFLDLETCLAQKPPYFKVNSRFSELSGMHQKLAALHPSVPLPQFPPKRWLGNKSSSFLVERMKQLNEYYSELLTCDDICNSALWDQVFAPEKSMRVAVVGCPGIGKVRLVEAFLNCSAETLRNELSPLTADTRGSELGQVCPMHFIVRQTLVCLKTLTILQYDKASDISAMRLLSGYDGVVLTYLAGRQETYEAVAQLRTRLSQRCVVAALNGGSGEEAPGELVRTAEDAYLVFHLLLESM